MLPRPIYSLLHLLLASPAVIVPLGMFLWILVDGPCAWYAASCNVVTHVHLVIFGVPVMALSILWLGFVNGRAVGWSPWVRLERAHLLAHREGVAKHTCEVCGWDYPAAPRDPAASGDAHDPCPGRRVPVRVSRRTRRLFERAAARATA
jgi:hypothetical protein